MKIYLDYNATTPVDKEVAQAMQPYLAEYFGNPSSSHSFGTETKKAVENARKQVASLINCKSNEIIFTSGGSESNNYAIKGFAFANEYKGNHIITSTIEHPAVFEVCKYLEKKGFQISYIPVDEFGIVDLEKLETAITPQTILISIMHANNEIGTIQPISEIAAIARKYNVAFHTDAAQSVGKYPVDVQQMGVDLLSVAGHKLYAPKGIGALFIRDGLVLEKLIHGADHEQNKRAGTENVLEIVGLGKACEIAQRDLNKNLGHLKRIRDLLHNKLLEKLPDLKLNGHPELRLPNTLNISFPGIEANILLNEMELKGIAASAGAACHTDSVDVSPVLTAIKLMTDYAMGTIRFSVGKYSTEEEINRASEIIIDIVTRLKPKEKTQIQEFVELTNDFKLTKYTQGLGCACKLRPQELEKILKDLPVSNDPNILIDTQNSDDAAVYKINETTALVQTVDFFTPIVDDPYDFGAIAAANSLSDIYAMGAKPLFALNIVGFPSNRLPMEVLKQILKGAHDKAREAEISILGGHTIDDPEPKYGMVVSGVVHPDKIWANSGALEGDAIILTKPIGTGILTTALKRGLVDQKTKSMVIQSMAELNKSAAGIIEKYTIHACTDVTGFGLIGHLSEISIASKMNVELFADKVPFFNETVNFATANIIPGGSTNNLSYFSKHVVWDKNISNIIKIVLCDAQTSGGLLFTIPLNEKDEVILKLRSAGISSAMHIGNCLRKGEGKIFVKS
ncbi:MAG: selenide, water dikinase SelD [Bacteroidetes bacterium GWC2_33_15]|nr:MAG: selenide, water dikinase SelD [Bacteroidetes bacterium GWA2_33_15]OFX49709.1 MAG: selenide, water dikinase SelD [Bacteroidetes bacterium GWC2_33_15]OFX65901.1 MAG: selenide, water dikinase SelD [Bacteroidetes bacterium GWB2_32_14]OFX68338.1 MAG: selenide, water dikinase SelD [Bacteroidetes bacterium GWD2_33_33]HAN18125.1 selenide, water dikinase SelD [Bacteroidales bacterium]